MSPITIFLSLSVIAALLFAIGACLDRIFWAEAPYHIRVKLNKKRRARRRRIKAFRQRISDALEWVTA